jgi:hypothetical protein
MRPVLHAQASSPVNPRRPKIVLYDISYMGESLWFVPGPRAVFAAGSTSFDSLPLPYLPEVS